MTETSSAFVPEETKLESPIDGDPTEADIAQLKMAFPGKPLFKTEVAKKSYIYTLLTDEQNRGINANIAKIEDIVQANETYRTQVLEKCVLWPRGFNMVDLADQAAGISYTLYEKIRAASALLEPMLVDEMLVPPAEAVEPTAEELTALKENPIYQKLGLAKRTIEQRYIDESGQLQSKKVAIFFYTAIQRLVYDKIIRENAAALREDPSLPGAIANMKLNADIVKAGTVWPKNFDYDNAPAGWTAICSAGISECSGFSSIATSIEDDEVL